MLVVNTESCQGITPERRIMQILTYLLFISLVFMITCTADITDKCQSVITEHMT